jgi:hypothetical protein
MTTALGAGKDLIITQASHMWRVTPSTGALVDLGRGWGGTTSIGSLTVSYDCYAIQNSEFWKVDPRTGAYTALSGVWDGPTQMTMADNEIGLYVIDKNNLWNLDVSREVFTKITTSTNWSGATSMAELPGESDGGMFPRFLYIMNGNQLVEVALSVKGVRPPFVFSVASTATLITFAPNFTGPTQMVAQY